MMKLVQPLKRARFYLNTRQHHRRVVLNTPLEQCQKSVRLSRSWLRLLVGCMQSVRRSPWTLMRRYIVHSSPCNDVYIRGNSARLPGRALGYGHWTSHVQCTAERVSRRAAAIAVLVFARLLLDSNPGPPAALSDDLLRLYTTTCE